ncbi:hypothetical protein B0T10DRAFT_594670, partial [Thelonectria olida]
PDVGDDRVSGEFEFQHSRSTYDEDLDINIHLCRHDKCRDRTNTVCFHSRCYEFSSYSITPAFLAATKYAFVPPAHEERRRADYIQRALAQNLQLMTDWPRELPLELWLMVAEPLIPDCAVLSTKELVHRTDTIGDSVLDLTLPVYATFVKIDGRYYVRRLLNALGTQDSKQVCLFLPGRTEKQGRDDGDEGKDLFVAEDHVGIRQVIFVSPGRRDEWCRSHPSVPGAWWKHIPREDIPSAVAIETNDSAGLRMRFFDCNYPDIIGYSVATDGAEVLAMTSHRQGQKPDRGLYNEVTSGICFWMYMPMNQNEYLTEICRRAGRLIMDVQVVGITV